MRIADRNHRLNPLRPGEKATCPICEDSEIKYHYVAKEMVNGTKEEFDYLLCNSCGTLYLKNPPQDIKKYYKDYYTNTLPEPRKQSASLKSFITRRIENCAVRFAMARSGALATGILEKYLKIAPVHGIMALQGLIKNRKDAILDVGCGSGTLVDELDRLGYKNVTGIDPFLANEVIFSNGASLQKKNLEETEGEFDLIMYHHCFEHIPDPQRTAKLISSKLKRGGKCLIRIPNINSVEFDRYGENWWGIHAPRHYYLFSPKSLEMVFEKAGLVLDKFWCDSLPDLYWYSYEYYLGISDIDANSVRILKEKNTIWTELERSHIEHNYKWYNDRHIGDWSAFVFKSKTSKPINKNIK